MSEPEVVLHGAPIMDWNKAGRRKRSKKNVESLAVESHVVDIALDIRSFRSAICLST